jgi:hypothetical protein
MLWIIAVPTMIVATIAKIVRNFLDAASISVSPPLAVGGERRRAP